MIPEGLVLLMSVTLAVAAVRLARMNTLVQQMAATEALAAVDTICVDKTGTLTDGTLDLVSVEVADKTQPGGRPRGAGAASPTRPGSGTAPCRRSPSATRASRSGWSPRCPSRRRGSGAALTLDGRGSTRSYVMGAPDVLAQAGALELPPPLQRTLEEHTAAGRRVVAFGETRRRLPADPASQPPPRLEPRALVVLEEQLRPDAAETIEFMRGQQVDLKLISGDARQTVTAVAHAVGVPGDAGVIEGPELPDDRAGLAHGRGAQHDLLPDHARSRRRRWSARSPIAGASRR